MKRIHVHMGVDDIEDGIRFYEALFGTGPVKRESDYAKWMLDDPRVSFAISTRADKRGVDHLGIQAEDDSELAAIRARLRQADTALFDEGEAVCCYARSDKSWVLDPAGVAWEAYRTMADVQLYSVRTPDSSGLCCAPETKGRPGCCEVSAATAGCCA